MRWAIRLRVFATALLTTILTFCSGRWLAYLTRKCCDTFLHCSWMKQTTLWHRTSPTAVAPLEMPVFKELDTWYTKCWKSYQVLNRVDLPRLGNVDDNPQSQTTVGWGDANAQVENLRRGGGGSRRFPFSLIDLSYHCRYGCVFYISEISVLLEFTSFFRFYACCI